MTGHVVTALAVQVQAGARAHYLERGALLPDGVAPDVIKRLVAEGFVEGVELDTPAEGDASDGQKTEGKKPDGRAGIEKLLEYAKANGIEVPEGADKDAVRALIDAHPAS